MGIIAIYNIPIELNPKVIYPKLTLSTTWNGVSSETIEAFVTSPIEAQLSRLKNVKTISSRSSEGTSNITVEFYPETDMDYARVEINEKLHSLRNELPYGVGRTVLSQYVPESFKELQGFITYTVSGNQSANQIRKLVKDKFIYELSAIDGVSEVSVYGGNERQITILIDFDKAMLLGVSDGEINSAIKDLEKILSGGTIENQEYQYLVKVNNKVEAIDVINEQVVKILPNGTTLKISDIGKVYDGYKEQSNYYRINGKETVTINIDKEPGKNSISTAELIYDKVEQISSHLPEDISVLKEIDKSITIKEEINTLTNNSIFSFIIIVLVLLIIFRSFKYTIVIVMSIVFSLLASILFLFLLDVSLNLITISSFVIGFGFMVDNSIVVVDYIDRYFYGHSLKRLAVHLKAVFSPVLTSTLTTSAVFLPLLFLTGELKLYLEQFAVGVVVSLTASLIVAFVIIPRLYISLKIKKIFKVNRKSENGEALFSSIMEFLIKRKKTAMSLLILLIGLPVWLLPDRIEGESVWADAYNAVSESEVYQDIEPALGYLLGGSLNLFFNHLSRGEVWQFYDPTYIYVRLELPNGNDISRINQLTKEFETEVLDYETNIKTLIAHVYDEESASLKVDFTKNQSLTAFPYLLKNYLSAYATRLGGLNVSVYGFGPGFSNAGGSSFTTSVIVKGFNYNRVKEIAQQFKEIISKNPRIDNVDIDRSPNYWVKDTYEIVGVLNRNTLINNSITVDNLFQRLAANAKGNISYNTFQISDENVNYIIKSSKYNNVQERELVSTLVKNGNSYFKIGDLVEFNESKVLSAILREDQQYIRGISFDYKGPYKYGNKFTDESIEKMNLPPGYTLEKRKFDLFSKEDEIDLWLVLFFAILLIFMITASHYESYIKPFYILLAIPFALVGVIGLFYLGDFYLDRGAYAGILLLVGLVVNNTILLINQYKDVNSRTDIDQIIKMSFTRIRPIITTSLTTLAALIPLVVTSDVAFWKSLSLSVMGGILISSVLVIIYLPLIYIKGSNIE